MSVALESSDALAEEDVLRAQFYNLLAHLLSRVPDDVVLARLAALGGDGSDMGQALGQLAEGASAMTADTIEDEYNALFIGVTRGDLVPYGSFYLTGFLNEKPLAALRGDMSLLGIAPGDEASDPEDHIGSLCEMMEGLIMGTFGTATAGSSESLSTQRDFFSKHVAPWAGQFFQDLEAAEKASLYRSVGKIGRLFMAIEEEAFRMVD